MFIEQMIVCGNLSLSRDLIAKLQKFQNLWQHFEIPACEQSMNMLRNKYIVQNTTYLKLNPIITQH